MNQPFHSLLQTDENPEVGNARDLSFDPRSHRIPLCDQLPRIGRELLNPQGETLVLDVHPENFHLDYIALFIKLRRVFDFLRPMKVGHMSQTIDALLYPDKNTKIGNVAHRPLDHAPDGIFLLHLLPGIRQDLF